MRRAASAPIARSRPPGDGSDDGRLDLASDGGRRLGRGRPSSRSAPTLRVAIVATSYPTDPDDAAGHFVRAEALALARAGHEVHVIAPRPAREPGIVAHAAGGERLFAWPGAVARLREDPSRAFAAPAFVRRSIALLREVRPDRTIAHWAIPSAFPVAIRAPGELAIVSHGADVRLLVALPAAIRIAIVRRLIDRDARFRFVATSLRDALLGALPAELAARVRASSTVAPPLVDVARAVPFAHPRPYAAFVGRLVASKRAELAIAAGRAADLDLVIAGDGPERDRLAALAGPRVRFLGRTSRPAALGVIAGARVLLHPSAVEAAPTTVLEARALGTEVVAAPAGDIEAWAARDAGIRVVREWNADSTWTDDQPT